MAAIRGRQLTTFGGLFTSIGLDGAAEPLIGEPLDLTLRDRDLQLSLKKRSDDLTLRKRNVELTLPDKRE